MANLYSWTLHPITNILSKILITACFGEMHNLCYFIIILLWKESIQTNICFDNQKLGSECRKKAELGLDLKKFFEQILFFICEYHNKRWNGERNIYFFMELVHFSFAFYVNYSSIEPCSFWFYVCLKLRAQDPHMLLLSLVYLEGSFS